MNGALLTDQKSFAKSSIKLPRDWHGWRSFPMVRCIAKAKILNGMDVNPIILASRTETPSSSQIEISTSEFSNF